MERVFFVKNGELKEVNEWLQKGGRIKMIQAVSETISSYGCGGGETSLTDYGNYVGDIYAYVVIEFN